MNIDLARTFLEILEAGTFNRAAERLHVTPSTVSMRMKSLEDALGRPLFVRSKAGTELTAAGIQFRRYAHTLVRTWQQARQEVALRPEMRSVLAIGGEIALWDGLLLDWLPRLRQTIPDIALRSETGEPVSLVQRLGEGLLDVVVTYAPQVRSGLVSERLFDERLILVSREDRPLMRWDPHYIYVDWGDAFRQAHGLAYPVEETPSVTFEHGLFGLRYILANGGSGYFPERLVAPLINDGRLFEVPDAPAFARSAYLMVSAEAGYRDWMRTALDGLRALAAEIDAGLTAPTADPKVAP